MGNRTFFAFCAKFLFFQIMALLFQNFRNFRIHVFEFLEQVVIVMQPLFLSGLVMGNQFLV